MFNRNQCIGRPTLPPLEAHCGSWMILDGPAGKAIHETHSERTAQRYINNGFYVETAASYLGRVNREIRNGSTRYNAR